MSKNQQIKCYASSLGNCSGGQSVEHYLSQCLFRTNIVTISGQTWLEGKEKTLSYNKAGLKILCVYHNKSLKPVDREGCNFFNCLNDCASNNLKMVKLPRSNYKPKKTFQFNGLDIERWMTKAAVGATFENKLLTWHKEQRKLSDPPEQIVESIFGLSNLKYPMGLYNLTANGEKVILEERAGLTLLHNTESGGYVGAIINLNMYHCLLWLCDESLEDVMFSSYTGVIFGKGYNQPVYHPKQIDFTAKGKIWSVININW